MKVSTSSTISNESRKISNNINSFSKNRVYIFGILLVIMLVGDLDKRDYPRLLLSYFSLSSKKSIKAPLISWSECITRFPGLLENEIYVPLPDRLANENTYIPKQEDIPVYVIVYNNPTFVKNMVEQIDCYGSHALLLDSGSTYQPMLDYLKNIENGPPSRSGIRHKVIYLQHNAGPYGAFAADLFADMPPFVAITDPDIYFNPHLPPNFLVTFANLTKLYPGRKIGFALSLDNANNFWPFVFTGIKTTIANWERKFWKRSIKNLEGSSCAQYTYECLPYTLEAYDAEVDTTFAVYDVKYARTSCKGLYCHFYRGIRLAGLFTAEHIPWMINFTSSWNSNETIAAYGSGSKGSTVSHALRAYGWLP